MTNPFAAAGGAPQKQPLYTPIFVDRAFTGLYTQRAVLHDPSDMTTAKFYGGRPDALLGGRNVELTNRLTLQRRPGMVPFGTNGGFTYSTTPDRAFSFQLADGSIRVIVDTESANYVVSSATNASAGHTLYYGTFPGGVNNGLVGLIVNISGFVTNTGNNGTFTISASTANSITVNNPIGIAETYVSAAVTAGGVYWDHQDGTADLLFPKAIGAGQSYFIAVAGVLYIGDGVDTRKYTPLNTNGTLWNWGIVAPSSQPSVTTVSSGVASTTWQKNTVFTTMGLTQDTNTTPYVWQIISTNADGSNPNSQFGTTGTGEPDWGTAPAEGNTVSDSSVVWTNAGNINNDWAINTFFTDLGYFGHTPPPNYSQPAAFNNMGLKTLYGNYKNSGTLGNTGLSESSEPHFSGAYPGPSGGYFDNNTHWFAIGTYNTSAQMAQMRWKKSTTYAGWQSGGSNDTIVSGNPQFVLTGNLPAPVGQPVFMFVPTTGGTSGSGYAPFPTSPSLGQIVGDGQISWMCLGNQAKWQEGYPYVPWTAQGTAFSAIFDGTNFQVCTAATGVSGGVTPSWNTGYGSTTVGDGGVTWTCVGPSVVWLPEQIWNLPNGGFQPPSSSQRFGGSAIDASNNYIQAVVSSGTSGSAVPSWKTTTDMPPTVTDNTVTWQAVGQVLTNSITWSYGFAYSYAYKARPVDDFYSPAPLGGGAIPPGSTFGALGTPTGSETNAISSASPVYQIVGANTAGAVNILTGAYSPDPQVDTIVIYRSADSASGANNMYELTEIPNIPSLAGVHGWTFQDYLPSVATGNYPGLNILLPAPIDDVNDPPPSTFLPQVYNYQRIWGSNGQSVPFSGGPDTFVGNPNEAFNPSDDLPFLAPVIRLVRTSQGIVTFLTDSVEMIGGGPATATFFSVTMAPGVGLLSYNACDVFAGEIYFFSSDNMFRVIAPNLNMSNFGFPLGDQFANQPSFGTSDANWDPTKVYVAVHQNGTDNCIFVADGSTGWYRLNPHQIPGAAQGPEPIWSPFADFVATEGGIKMVQSVEISPGVKKLMAGPVGPGNIIVRDLTTFTDEGATYDAYFMMGSIKLAEPGQMALLKFLELDFSGVQLQPQIGYLLNEISGTFTEFVNGENIVPGVRVPVFDPPALYGETLIPESYSPNRYYFSSNADLAKCRHMQVKVDFGGGPITYTANIQAVSILSNVLTLTVDQTIGFVEGQVVTLSGLTDATFLNNETIVLTSVTPTTLVAAFYYGNYSPMTVEALQAYSAAPVANTTNISVPVDPKTGTWALWINGSTINCTDSNYIPPGWTTLGAVSDYTGSFEVWQNVSGPFTASATLHYTGSPPGQVALGTNVGQIVSFTTTGTPTVLYEYTGGGAWSGVTTGHITVPISSGSVILVINTTQNAYDGVPSSWGVRDDNGNTYQNIVFQAAGTGGPIVAAAICWDPVVGGTPNVYMGEVGQPWGASATAFIMEISNLTGQIIPDTGTGVTNLNDGDTMHNANVSLASITSNVLSLTVDNPSGIQVGQALNLGGFFGNASFLTNQTIFPTGISGDIVTAPFTHADTTTHTIYDTATTGASDAAGDTVYSFTTNVFASFPSGDEVAIISFGNNGTLSGSVGYTAITGTSTAIWYSSALSQGTELVSWTPSGATAYCWVGMTFSTTGGTITPGTVTDTTAGGSGSYLINLAPTAVVMGQGIYVSYNDLGAAGGPGATCTDDAGNTYIHVGYACQGTLPTPGHAVNVFFCPSAVSTGNINITITADVSHNYTFTSGVPYAFSVGGLGFPAGNIGITGTYTLDKYNTGDEMYSMTIFGRYVVE